MSGLAVDTSVLLAILKGEAKGEAWRQTLRNHGRSGAIMISSIVLAELRSFCPSDHLCQDALRRLDIQHSPMTEESALLGGQIFRAYRNEGGPRKTILPDFMVAAHAVKQAGALATEDRGYMRTYFPTMRLVMQDTSP